MEKERSGAHQPLFEVANKSQTLLSMIVEIGYNWSFKNSSVGGITHYQYKLIVVLRKLKEKLTTNYPLHRYL